MQLKEFSYSHQIGCWHASEYGASGFTVGTPNMLWLLWSACKGTVILDFVDNPVGFGA